MPHIDYGLIAFNSLLAIGVIYILRNSSKKDKEETKELNKENKKHGKEEINLTRGEYLLKEIREKISKSKMPIRLP